MKTFLRSVLLAGMVAIAPVAAMARSASSQPLAHWPEAAASSLKTLVSANAGKGAYAVFDADNTLYRYDLEESLLPYLERKGVLSRESMDPSLKIIPFKDVNGHKESLNSYYYRLCEIDDQVCYPWVAQIFSGFTLAQLKGFIDEMLADGKPIPATYYEGDAVKTVEISPPKFYTGQQELVNHLTANGIEVYVMTAASEELVRMVVSDPKYGYNIKPQNVIGVTMLLKNRATGEMTTARKLIAEGKYDWAKTMDLELGTYLWAPLTWFAGKHAAILTYIDQWKKPVLVAGDTPTSDGYMLLHSTDAANGGLRVWVNRKDKYMKQIKQMWEAAAAGQAAQNLPVLADRNWVVVQPNDIQ